MVRAVAEAYYLSGWVLIHCDNHTDAYKIWSEGARAIPGDERLSVQDRKREVWDTPSLSCGGSVVGDDHVTFTDAIGIRSLLGDSKHYRNGVFDITSDFDVYCVPRLALDCHKDSDEPALALFDDTTQDRAVVFRTRHDILTKQECDNIIAIADAHVQTTKGGEWGTVRESSVKTTDIAVEDIPALIPWLHMLMDNRLQPMLRACFPLLGDGSDLGSRGHRVRIHDAFIVRYDAKKDMSLSLPEHSDTSAMSFTVALNDDFEGGGTWFECLDASVSVVKAPTGHATAFAGPCRHAGYPITKGTRYILVLFLYVHEFQYGVLLERAREKYAECMKQTKCEPHEENTTSGGDDDAIRPSGMANGGYVVYRQTVELASMLDNLTLE